jgi:hypothetical protein
MNTAFVQLTLDELVTGTEIPPQGGIQATIEPCPCGVLSEAAAAGISTEIPPEISARLESLTAGEQRYLLGPIVYHLGGWDAGDILPKFIPQARLELVLSGEKNLATLEEALAYLASASLCFPLSSEDAQVMFWLSQEVWAKHKLIRDDQPIWEMLGHDKPFVLTPYLENEVLNSLRRKLRAAVVRHSTARPAKKRQGGIRHGGNQIEPPDLGN